VQDFHNSNPKNQGSDRLQVGSNDEIKIPGTFENLFRYLSGLSVDTRNTEGTWDSVTLSGKLDALSPALRRFRWLILDQARFKDDSREQGMRFSEDLLYVQIG
jgi:hypothetical protein